MCKLHHIHPGTTVFRGVQISSFIILVRTVTGICTIKQMTLVLEYITVQGLYHYSWRINRHSASQVKILAVDRLTIQGLLIYSR